MTGMSRYHSLARRTEDIRRRSSKSKSVELDWCCSVLLFLWPCFAHQAREAVNSTFGKWANHDLWCGCWHLGIYLVGNGTPGNRLARPGL